MLEGIEHGELLGRVAGDALGGAVAVDDFALSVANGDHLRDVVQDGVPRQRLFFTSCHS